MQRRAEQSATIQGYRIKCPEGYQREKKKKKGNNRDANMNFQHFNTSNNALKSIQRLGVVQG